MHDEYLSIEDNGECTFRDRGSKFYGYALPVSSVTNVNEQLDQIRGKHPKARHFCYAYIIGSEGSEYRANDDGEPSGSAGLPILNTIKGANLKNILIVVVRYFGGTKLGIPGLIHAYKTTAQGSLDQVETIKKYITRELHILYQPKDLGKLYDVIKKLGISEIENKYEPIPTLIIQAPYSKALSVKNEIYAKYYGYAVNDIHEDFESEHINIQLL